MPAALVNVGMLQVSEQVYVCDFVQEREGGREGGRERVREEEREGGEGEGEEAGCWEAST
jgi:hypothetical protein